MVFRRGRWAAGIAAVLTCLAMLAYPGGTALDRATRGYSISHNFLSDLGMTVSWGGKPNTVGAALFVTSLCTVVVGLGACLVGFIRIHSKSPGARRMARLAGVAGLLVCAAFIGVAVTPENRVMALHVGLTLFAFRAFPAVTGFLAVAAARDDVFPRRVAVGWAVLTAVLLCYVAMLGWGPELDTPAGLRVQVVAQKVVAIAAVGIISYHSYLAERALQ